MERKYKYLGYFMMLLIPIIFLAFYKSYFVHFPKFSSKIHVYDHIHAAIASIWILMLVIQPVLIRNRKYETHRKIGRLSYYVFPLLILSFIPREIIVFQSGSKADLFFPVGDTLVLIPLYLLGIYHRKNAALHMRYMISSALVFLGPTIGRIGPGWIGWSGVLTQHVQYSIIYAILISLILYDNRKAKKTRPYLVAIAFFMAHQLTFSLIFL